MNDFDPRDLRRAFSAYMTGVTVVTTMTENSVPLGFTANSFTSVSLDPPLLLVCPAKSLSCYEVFERQGFFSVNILAEGQQSISNLFAGPSEDRFAGIEWTTGKTGMPLIAGTSARFECSKHQWIEAGDHAILVGEVVDYHSSDKDGLGYSKHGYFDLAMERRAQELQTSSASILVGAIIDFEGEILLVKENDHWALPSATVDPELGSLNTLNTLLDTMHIEATFGPIYSIFEDRTTRQYHIYYRAHARTPNTPEPASYFPLDPFLLAQFQSPAIKSMMTRYLNEQENNQFGLYYGDADSGDVQLFR